MGVFDRIAAITAASEKVLARANLPYRKIYVHPADHAGYYPGAEQMTLKARTHLGRLFDAVAWRSVVSTRVSCLLASLGTAASTGPRQNVASARTPYTKKLSVEIAPSPGRIKKRGERQ